MSSSSIRRLTFAGLFLLAAIGVALAVDTWDEPWVASHALFANAVVTVISIPLSYVVVVMGIEHLNAEREKARWVVLNERALFDLTHRWNQLRSLLVARYSLETLDESIAIIEAARAVWRPIKAVQDQEDQGRLAGSAAPAVSFAWDPQNDEILTNVGGLWVSMWGALVEDLEVRLERSVRESVVNRVNLTEPSTRLASRELIDALDDLTGQRSDLMAHEGAFASLEHESPSQLDSSEISINEGDAQLTTLDDLAMLIATAQAAVDKGDALIMLLGQPVPNP